MPQGWVLKKKIVRSKKFRQLYGDDFAQLVYCLITACKGSWGIMPADPDSLKIELGPFDCTREPADYYNAVRRLVAVDLVRVFIHQGDHWLYVVGHDREHPMSGRRGKHSPVPIPTEITKDEYNCNELDQTEPDCTRIGLDRIGLKGSDRITVDPVSSSTVKKSNSPVGTSGVGPVPSSSSLPASNPEPGGPSISPQQAPTPAPPQGSYGA